MTESNIDKSALISAVENFAQKHDMKQFDPKQKRYRELIPQKGPDATQQYAFEVDLDKCTGCKACVTACHNENGLDEDETWRSVGLIQGGTSAKPVMQHITSACHHCMEPACMKGCPTLAYTKDETTGIVKHLDDQCFGCQYCILKCPYDVPKYNKKKGIVHKCDMCVGRLSAGQAPACVRACPTGAIRITLVDKQDVKQNFQSYVNVADSPGSDYTFPTTQYKTKRYFPANMESVDYYTLKLEHSHLPLVFMLVLTQLSVGAFGAELWIRAFMNKHFQAAFQAFHVPVALGIGLLALASSILHLGRPHVAFRAILGFKTSWLSREILAFGLFAKLAILYALGHWFDIVKSLLELPIMGTQLSTIVAFSVFASGILGVICSVMVYRDTKRPFWDTHLTTFKFFMTSFILGTATTLLTVLAFGAINPDVSLGYINQYFGHTLAKAICIATCIKMMIEASIFIALKQSDLSFIKKTAVLMAGPLRPASLWRFACGLVGGVLIPILFMQLNESLHLSTAVIFPTLILGILMAGELFERYLFFKAVVPLKMPGGQAS